MDEITIIGIVVGYVLFLLAVNETIRFFKYLDEFANKKGRRS